MGRSRRRRSPFSFWAGPSRPPTDDPNNDSITSLSSPGAASGTHGGGDDTSSIQHHPTPSSPSSCCCFGALAAIASHMLDTERHRCALEVHEAYDNHSRYFRPVEVSATVERLIRRCLASLSAIDSVTASRQPTTPIDENDDHDHQQQRSGENSGVGAGGLWLLLSATNVEAECLLALLHLSAALDVPTAWAGLVAAGVELERDEDDDSYDGDFSSELVEPASPSSLLLYPWLIQEASINGSFQTLQLLLENAPALVSTERRGGFDIEDGDTREMHSRHSADSAIPFRPCRMVRADVLRFLEQVSATLRRLKELNAENPWTTSTTLCRHNASETWGESSTTTTMITAAAAADLLLSPTFSNASNTSLASSVGGGSSRLPKMVTMEEWDDCIRQLDSRGQDKDDIADAVERTIAQSLLESSLAQMRPQQHPPSERKAPMSSARVARRLLSPQCGSAPLHWASYKGHANCSRLLLRHGADPNAVAVPTGWTPLHDAAYSNSTEVLQVLLDAGANVNATAASGATPLCFACQENAVDATQLLLERGANVLPSTTGTNPLAPAPFGSRSGGDSPRMPLVPPPPFGGLMSSTSPPPLAGYTPLHYCARFNSARAARVLLMHCRGSIRNAKNGDGNAALITKLLDAPDSYGRRPIDIACIRASADVLRELLHHGATVENGAQRPTRIAPPRDTPTPYGSEPRTVQELISLIPLEPVVAPKPWNCLTQESIDACRDLLRRVEGGWSSENLDLFTPHDRAAADFIRRTVRSYMEQERGVYREMWPAVLSYCGRGWFVPSE